MSDRQNGRPHLRVIQGGAQVMAQQGPISRLGLWDNFRPLSKRHLLFLFLPKLLLLGTLLYYLITRA